MVVDVDIMPPQAKRPRLEADHPHHSVGDCVLRRTDSLLKWLNLCEIQKYMNNPILSFLMPDEERELYNLQDKGESDERVIGRLLYFLRVKGAERDHACRQFVACIVHTAEEERGHKELKKIFCAKLPNDEWTFIEDLLREINESPLPSPYRTPQPHSHKVPITHTESPGRPVPLIELQGQLAEKNGFGTIEWDLWQCFSKGDYDSLEKTVLGIRGDQTFKEEVDCQVVAMWFNSLIIMHRDGGYSGAIKELNDALLLCDEENCVNKTILQGRIYQRMTQNYLMMNLKELAEKTFELAKEKLQMVERGYDKVNMFCRKAKIMSAHEPHKREEIEQTYDLALRALEPEDPYFLASFPSVTLSKAGFYMKVSFGSKASGGSTLPDVCPADIAKAEETLKTIDEKEHILLEMRRFEHNFLCAELCRLKGEQKKARELFTAITSTPGSKKVKNILSLAEQRLQSIR